MSMTSDELAEFNRRGEQITIMLSRDAIDAKAWRRDDAIRQELLAACVAQHEAIDRLAAKLIAIDDQFLLSRSGQPWDALCMGDVAIRRHSSRSRYKYSKIVQDAMLDALQLVDAALGAHPAFKVSDVRGVVRDAIAQAKGGQYADANGEDATKK